MVQNWKRNCLEYFKLYSTFCKHASGIFFIKPCYGNNVLFTQGHIASKRVKKVLSDISSTEKCYSRFDVL